ncbi:hypothetical protein BRD16_05785 [Halobacteriales archaeon SW_6_65_46]|nr:MAG: hypothetical protein BRD16_05785 [Halobacteriales archaeon SW_6_65_46]
MHEDGWLAPATEAEAHETYNDLAPAARTVVRETAKAMSFDREEYDDRITNEVVETALDALFASLLRVAIGTRAEFETARAETGYDADIEGSDAVENTVWHVAPATETIVAATFQDAETAAVGTLRRQAFGKVYRDVLNAEGAEP